MDPSVSEGSNNRFWKIASELLGASMSIYDKRVENMYQNTYRVCDNLNRVSNNRQEFSEEEEQ